MDRGESKQREPHPKETSNLISWLSFFYTIKFFTKGYKKTLEKDDLYDVLESCRSKELGDRLEQQWNEELKKTDKPSISLVLFKCFGKQFIFLGILQFIIRAMVTTLSPQALSKIIAYFSPGQTELTQGDAIYYSVVGIGLTFTNLLFNHNCHLAFVELGIQIRAAVCALIYRKSLRLNTKSLSEVTVGKIVTVMTKDIDTYELFAEYGNNVWIGMVQTIIICYLIYTKIGLASFAGIIFFLIILPVQILMSRMMYFFRLKSSKKTDERLELTQQILSAIKIIKIYTWERYFEKKIDQARKKELKELHKIFYTKFIIVIIGGLCSKIGFFLFLMTHVWMGNSITAEIVYYIMSCFNDLEYSLIVLIPISLGQTAEAYSTSKRAESILHAAEINQISNPDLVINTKQQPEIIFNDSKIQCGNNHVISNIYLTITNGLNIVVGQVGFGKTTFLKAILNNNKNVQITGTISYASQEPWLFPSTIQNNILFGEKFDKARYEQILEICALKYDLEMLIDGDQTIVGERGINLSKGQQARINLARAVYKQSDIYLLDDCLAALDGFVSDSIFNKCIQQFLADKLCVVVTNNFEYIKKANRLIIVDKTNITQKLNSHELHNELFNCLKNVQEQIKVNEKIPERQEIFHENKKPGEVNWSIYKRYIQYGGGFLVTGGLLALFALEQSTSSYSEKLMSNWVTLEQNLSMYIKRNTTEFQELYKDRTNTLNFYTAIVLATIFLSLVKSIAFFNVTRLASIRMHQAMVSSLLNAKMSFFDTSFIGNVLNRFSLDLFMIDEWLPFTIIECLTMVFITTGGVVLLTSVNYIFLIETFILLVIGCAIKMFYQPTGRNLQRINALARSPMIGHLNSTFEGLQTIRASRAQEIITREFERHQNMFTTANYCSINAQVALDFALDFCCTIFVTVIILQFLCIDFGATVGDVGLAITQAFVVVEILVTAIKSLTTCENQMTSVERILEYTEIEQENKNGELVEKWPSKGLVSFEHVSLKYNENSNQILEDINFTVQPNHKLGIVGRTGAGKSSIISSLLRLYESEGKILIDKINTKKISLNLLRSNIAVIPQDPFIFLGTIRENIDPFKKFSDEKIWKIFEELHLREIISDLNMTLDKGICLSAGQKQLFCLARAILQNCKIVILDEATANVDQETDILIQEIIKNKFFNCTVIIIAHRLLSILHCDKVIVLNNGQICEFDDPQVLLQNKNSFLHCVIK